MDRSLLLGDFRQLINIIRSGNRPFFRNNYYRLLMIPVVNSYHLLYFIIIALHNSCKINLINDLIVFIKVQLWL